MTKLHCDGNIIKSLVRHNKIAMERYRSGHNGAVLKTVCLHGRMGSNPILSAENHLSNLRWFFYARGYEIPDGRSNDTEDFLIRYIWYVKLTLTQCNDEENKVKKFFKKLLDKLLNKCYSIIAVGDTAVKT